MSEFEPASRIVSVHDDDSIDENDRTQPIRVLIVDDSEMAQELLEGIFSSRDDFIIVGIAQNGAEGVTKAHTLRPDLITMDLLMPEMDGYRAVELIMARSPTPILVVTSHREAETAFRCISLGALDVVDKPTLDEAQNEEYVESFLNHAALLAGTKVIGRAERREQDSCRGSSTDSAVVPDQRAHHLVVVASSTGGPQALSILLKSLPRSFLPAMVVVQHLTMGFEDGLTRWLQGQTEAPVRLFEDRMPLLMGTIVIARPGHHLQVTADGLLQRLDAEPIGGHRPSAEPLFQSAARMYGHRCAGVVLTGMGDDGARALGDIKEARGLTIAQDEATSTIYGMPRVAVELGHAAEVLPIGTIGARLSSWWRSVR